MNEPLSLKVNGQVVTPSVVVAGIDFGYADPFVIEVGAKVGSVWLNFYEVYAQRLGVGEVLKETLNVVRRFRLDRLWADAEDPQMIRYLQSHGIPVIPNQIKDVDFGIQTVYGLMKQVVDHPVLGRGPKFRVDGEACPNLVREASQYGYSVVRGEVQTGRPIDKHNHAWDAVRYYITGEGEVPTEVFTPEQKRRAGMYVKDGRWHDDPVGYQIAMMRRNRIEPDDWWDERMGSLLDQEDLVAIDDDLM